MSIIPHKDGYFPITSVHRDDLESVGFDTSRVDDGVMLRLAEKMADAYLESDAFWMDLEMIAEDLEIPRKQDAAGCIYNHDHKAEAESCEFHD